MEKHRIVISPNKNGYSLITQTWIEDSEGNQSELKSKVTEVIPTDTDILSLVESIQNQLKNGK